MANRIVSAIDIKELKYCAKELVTQDLTKAAAMTLWEGGTNILNVHQDTWTIDETEASQDFYKNQLTKTNYRKGAKTMGDVTFNFTIGAYDFVTKANLMGGETIMDGGKAIGWKRARKSVEMELCMMALTTDDVLCILPRANVSSREANTDGAIGLATVATALEPDVESVSPEYWFDVEEEG